MASFFSGLGSGGSGGGIGGGLLNFLGLGGFLPTGANSGTSTGIPGVEVNSNNLQNILNGLFQTGPVANSFQNDLFGNPKITWTSIASAIPALIGILGGGSAGASANNAGTGSGSTLNNISQFLGSLFGTGAGVYGGINNLQQQEWDNSARINVLNELRRLSGGAEGQASALNGLLFPQLASQMSQTSAGSASNADIANRLNYMYNFLPDLYMNPTSADAIPGLRAAFDYLGGAQTANNRGLQTAFGQLESGPNALTPAATGAGLSAIATRGMTPEIAALIQQAQQTMAPRPELETANRTAASILSQNPLLSLEDVVSLVTGGAARDARNQFNTSRRELLDRTGVVGPATASGGLNDFLAQAGDTALDAVSKARIQAILGQQGLQQQQFGAGASLLGTAANASQGYTGQGLQSILSALSQAQNRETSLPSTFANLYNSDTNRLGTNYNGVTNLLENALAGNQQRINAVTGLQQFGQNRANNLTGALGQMLGLQQGNANAQTASGNFATGQTGDLLGNWINFLSQSGNQQANLFNNGNNINNPFASFLGGR